MEDKGEFMQRKILRTRKEILDQALKLFNEKGYENVSLDEIAHKATLSRATLYNYYQNKKTIYFAIHMEHIREDLEKIAPLLSLPYSGKDIILMLSTQILRSYNENWIYSQILSKFLIENTQRDNIARKVYETRKKDPHYKEPKYKDLENIMADYLEQILIFQEKWVMILNKGIKDGSIKSILPPLKLVNYISMLLTGIMEQKNLRQIGLERNDVQLDYENIEKITLELVKILLE